MPTNTNRHYRTIPLNIQPPAHPAIRFLWAEVNDRQYVPFALITYSIGGAKRRKALRLDLDKRVFIDPQDEEAPEAEFSTIANGAAPAIAERVARDSLQWFMREQ